MKNNNNNINNKLIQFTNCRLVRNHEIIRDDFWIRNGKIINPEPVFFEEKSLAHIGIDCGGAIIAPGYIDLQINGAYGIDFSHNTKMTQNGIEKVAQGLIENGVTSFCPTIVTSPAETYHEILPLIPKTIQRGAGVLGVHLEGPFISPLKKGAHPIECIKTIDNSIETLLQTYGTLENIKIITLAPELVENSSSASSSSSSSKNVINELTKAGITVSLGHSMACLSEGEFAVRNGAKLITHLFNAMLPFHHRDPGLVGLLASDAIPANQTVYFSIIADGVHTHSAALRIAYRTHPDGLILVTDAISALGLTTGIHHLGQLTLEVRNGKAFIANTDTLCGSITPMDECVRIFHKATGCSTAYAIETASLHPAQCLGIEDTKGTLDFNSDADFIILDDELNVCSTWIAGNCVYSTTSTDSHSD